MAMTVRMAWVATALGGLLAIGVPALDAQPTRMPSAPAPGRGGIEGDPIPLGTEDPRFKEYLAGVAKEIRSHWVYPCAVSKAGSCEHKTATVVIEFGILKSGALRYLEVRQGAALAYEDSAVAAIKLSAPFPALPPEVVAGLEQSSTGLPVIVTFNYVVQHRPWPSATSSAPDPPYSAASLKAGVITRADGPVSVERLVRGPASAPVERLRQGQATTLKTGDAIFVQDRVVTGDGARAEIVLGGKVAVAIGERSLVVITEIPGRSTVNLETGQIAIAVGVDQLRGGEAIAARTSNALATIRGEARMIVEVVPPVQQGSGVVTHIDVIGGSVSVVMPGGSPGPTVELRANDGITITGAVIGPIRAARPVQ